MKRLMLLGMLLVVSAVGCRSADKKDAVASADPPRYQMPNIITAEKWWRKGELGDVEP